MTTETLAPDIGWEPTGHLSEIALSAAADGEDALLDAEMHEHLGACDECAMRLGHAALRSADVAEAFAQVIAHKEQEAQAAPATARPVSPRARRRVPIFAIAAALVVATLGAAPAMMSAPAEATEAWIVVRKVAPSMVRLLPHAISRAWSGPVGPLSVLVWCMAGALMLTGFGIAKRASKRALVDGGRR